jgi:hypothetical protein
LVPNLMPRAAARDRSVTGIGATLQHHRISVTSLNERFRVCREPDPRSARERMPTMLIHIHRPPRTALLLQLDVTLPNLALMRLAAHLRERNCDVHFKRMRSWTALQDSLFAHWDDVYASAIFEKTRPLVEELKRAYPKAIVGGTGSGSAIRLEEIGVSGLEQDYSLYPRYAFSIGFTQRGCRLRCPFCVVPWKEGKVKPAQSIQEIWRGDSWPRNLVLLDNDFFGQAGWRDRISEIAAGEFKVSFTQGINVRVIDEEIAAAVAGVQYYDHEFRTRRIYTAWDNRKDEARLFRGLDLLVKAGVKPDQIMVYMLIGYWRAKRMATGTIAGCGCASSVPGRIRCRMFGRPNWSVINAGLFGERT